MFIDFETYSEADIKVVGAWLYAKHPSTEILCMGYQSDDMPEPKIWQPGEPLPFEIEQAIKNKETFHAHNAAFEQWIWYHICHKKYGWCALPSERWMCTAAQAASHALPRKLADLSTVLRLSETKDMEGHRTMLQLSRPRNPSQKDVSTRWYEWNVPDKFRILREYCAQDVKVERLCHKHLRPLPPDEHRIWLLDQTVNRRGVKLDRWSIECAIHIHEDNAKNLLYKLRDLTKGRVTSASQVKLLAEYLGIPDVTAARVNTLLADPALDPTKRAILQIRKELGRSSIDKYYAYLANLDDDDRIRDHLLYHAATTGRWGGLRMQLHNLIKGKIKNMDECVKLIQKRDYRLLESMYGNTSDVLTSAVRGMIIGEDLIAADYSGIEARILAWLAGQEDLVEAFKEGKDIYKTMAAVIYGIPEAEVTKEQRELGKQAVLGCGFQMGASRFHSTCEGKGIMIPITLAEDAVQSYRNKFPKIKHLWYGVERAVKQAINSKKTMEFRGLRFGMDGHFLRIRLLSGRTLAYPYAQIREDRITFEGSNSLPPYTWGRQETYGGKLVENIVQATARDIMAYAMLRCEAAGYKVLFSVHDEIICEKARPDLQEYISLLTEPLTWSKGCPIKAEGWIGYRYRK